MRRPISEARFEGSVGEAPPGRLNWVRMTLMKWTERVGGRRALSGAAVAAVALPAVLLAAHGTGLPASRVELSGGTAWLGSPAQGVVTLIDGASEQVIGYVLAPAFRPGDDLGVVQSGSSAYLVSSGAGTVARVDGATYEVSPPVQFGDSGPSGQLQVYAGRTSTYIVDGQRRTATVADPASLRVRQQLALAAQPGPGQSVVDDAGRLWVVDKGGLAWFDQAGKHVRPELGGPDTRLVLVRGQPVLVDLGRVRTGWLTGDGTVKTWSCLDLSGADQVQLLGSTALNRVLAANPATGTLIESGSGGDDCGRTVNVGRPGDRFGPLVEAGGFVLVPNQTTGHTAVVDLGARQVVADLDVTKPGSRLELLSKDGVVFYNDLDGDKAGVIKFAGGRWVLGKALQKYGKRAGAGVLTASGDQPQPRRPQPTPQPGQQPGQRQPDDPANPTGRQPVPTGPGSVPTGPGGAGSVPLPPPPPSTGAPGNQPPGTGTVSVRVVGAGFVSALRPAPRNAPAGARCAADSTCGWDYQLGATAVLEIPNKPTAQVLLDRVLGCTRTEVRGGSTLCNVKVARAGTVQAVFVDGPPPKVTLTVTRGGAGTVTATVAGGQPETCDPTCTVTVDPGTSVQLAATAGGGSYLADWGDAGCARDVASCDFTLATNRAVAVVFAPLLGLTVSVGGTGTGTVAGTGLACNGNTCTGQYRSGDVVALAATAGARSSFTGFAGCASDGPTSCTVTITANTAVSATFSHIPDTTPPVLTISGGGQTSTMTSGASVTLAPGQTSLTLTVSASDPESAVTETEIWNSYTIHCSGGGLGQVQHVDAGAPSATANGPSLVWTLNVSALASCPRDMPEMSVDFGLSGRATSEGGQTGFAAGFGVHYSDS